ncbi:MAG: DNA (cytosine-5-)-methyltransferase [Methylococcales bacterium]|nr:DNA (cytosine-5-)-methyltransferase [Methylococcales bacterium]
MSVYSIDNDSAAVKTHNPNFGEHSICTNIEDWLAKEPTIPETDLVIGGPPCQDFSLLNKKRHGDERRVLWEPFMDVIDQSKAKIFIIENVDGLLKSTEFEEIQKRAQKNGFNIQAGILNSANYGTPQTRRRTIIVGWKSNSILSPIFSSSTNAFGTWYERQFTRLVNCAESYW